MNLLAPSFVSTLGWALVHFLWQGLAIGLAAAVALMLLRNARPQARYAVACAALALCLLLPALAIVRGLGADETAVATSTIAQAAATPVAHPTIVGLSSWQWTLQIRLPWIVAIWSLGAALLALRMAVGLAWVNRLRRACEGAVDPSWQARLDGLAAKFGLRKRVALRVVGDLESPIAAGWWRPVVLVPAALIARMPPELLEALLAHELAHIRRHDYLVNLAQSAIEALLFYHPVVWWLSKRIRVERECIADDLAAQAIGEPRRMALALQRLDLLLSSRPPSGGRLPTYQPAHAANGDKLMSRIQRLVRPGQHTLSWKIALPILGLSAICITVFAQSNVQALETSSRSDAYALVRNGHESMTVSGTTRDIRAADKAKRSVQGDFLWFRRGDEAYVVQDAAILAKVSEAWKPTEALGAKMEALGKQMEAHGKKMDVLSGQMQAASDSGQPADAELQKIAAKMETLAEQQQAAARQMEKLREQKRSAAADGDLEALERKSDALHAQMDALSAAMDAQSRRLEAAHAPMTAISAQMEEASKPMEALGRQMEALGKQQEKLSRDADRTVRVLIDESLKTGKALPTSKFN
ncbi:M48 family metalloprotease [Luteimonas sp. SX5]|uniref:M48 family metalloprotease n=1 Tax=Luteimonas galliterrae TaxID=2940486 RepID=A0ABT0MEW9_9GAMM|nr:M56 family metallopeptidase [Luteimonas galliterrae]MCL1633412.1 M48 family metalloprotease [Luteimonas galliterrae]